ncbi:MAG: hypothetical protein RLZ98_2636 [Pseudomonadota bacterium]|jgi:hypothetical protein
MSPAKPISLSRILLAAVLLPMVWTATLPAPPAAALEGAPEATANGRPSPNPGLDLRATLGGKDQLAALRTIHRVLTEVEDGATYVWRRRHGRLGGMFKSTLTLRDAKGRTCRHLVMRLYSGAYSRRVEGIACRASDGSWQLEG